MELGQINPNIPALCGSGNFLTCIVKKEPIGAFQGK